jgi:hypothetical protein
MLRHESLDDATLAAHARKGDGSAFAELARRYRRLIRQTIGRGRPAWLDANDERQEALVGLFYACRAHDPAVGTFGALATVCVRRAVWKARLKARAPRHDILTDALGLDVPIRIRHRDDRRGGELRTLANTLPAPDHADPACVIELRERLRQAVIGEVPIERLKRRKAPARRRFSDEQVARALSLVAEGKTLREAGAAVGATHPTVLRWLNAAA